MLRPWLFPVLMSGGLAALSPAVEPAIHFSEPLCIAQGFTRVSSFSTADLPPGKLRVAVTPATLAQAEVVELDPGHGALHVRAKTPGRGELHLFDANQREVAHSQVQVIAMASTTTKSISDERTLADGSVIFHGELILTPYVPGLDLRFNCTGASNTIPDGLREWWVASETFNQTPAGTGWIPFRMLRAPRATWVPYAFTMYQDGEQVTF